MVNIHEMTRYLLNSPVLTDYGHWHYRGPLSIERAREFVRQAPFVSAIGHAQTAKFLTDKLGVTIPCARLSVHLEPGDLALVFRLQQRLAEGEILSADMLDRLPFSFGLLERLD